MGSWINSCCVREERGRKIRGGEILRIKEHKDEDKNKPHEKKTKQTTCLGLALVASVHDCGSSVAASASPPASKG
jgi:hypothetical protein